jgi:hypothetical protein
MFPDSMVALEALDTASRVEVLITGPSFAPRKPSGIALARTALTRRPHIRVLFMARSDLVLFTQGMGELLQAPVEVSDIVHAVRRVLPPDPKSSG